VRAAKLNKLSISTKWSMHIWRPWVAKCAGRLGIVQRVLPRYRAPFFDLLAQSCEGGLGIFAGAPRPDEAIPLADELSVAKWTFSQNHHFFRGAFYLCMQDGILDWLESWDPEALVVEANPRYLATPGAVRWMRRRGHPVLAWGLGAPRVHSILAGMRKLRRLNFLRQFDGVIAYSQQGADEYAALGFPATQIFVAPNSVSPRPSAAPQRNYTGQLTVLYVGRLQARKRLDALIRACAQLPRELQPKLVFVGDGPERESLERLASGLYPQAQFRGALFGKDLDDEFANAHLFVLPGTGGLAVQQAMAHALPVIVAEGDGSQRDLVSSANGWLLPPGDDAALLSVLREALRDPARLQSMGAESFRLVQTKFNLEAMVAAFVEALNKVAV
jgi:glycosyltransferase involved in cell wall biosynthesis